MSRIDLKLAKKLLSSSWKGAKLSTKGISSVGKAAVKHKAVSIPLVVAGTYLASDASNFADKQRAKMMLENHRNI